MSKTLILFRHAHSQGMGTAPSDHERKLSERGEQDSASIGKQLTDKNAVPEFIIVSSAVRAQTTLAIASKAGAWSSNTIVDESIYETNADQTLKLIQNLDNNLQSVMLVGHEPTWSNLGNKLVNGGNLFFSTGNMACLTFPLDSWKHINYGDATMEWKLEP